MIIISSFSKNTCSGAIQTTCLTQTTSFLHIRIGCNALGAIAPIPCSQFFLFYHLYFLTFFHFFLIVNIKSYFFNSQSQSLRVIGVLYLNPFSLCFLTESRTKNHLVHSQVLKAFNL